MIDRDREIEAALIGSLLVWYAELQDKLDGLEPDDFYFFKKLFEAIRNHHQEGNRDMDLRLFASRLSSPELVPVLKECLDRAVSVHAVDGYIARLLEMSGQRRLTGKLQDILFSGDIRLEALQEVVDSESRRQSSFGTKQKALDNIDRFVQNLGKKQERILTGFSRMDAVLGGLRKPSVCYIGARPSTGKTALALNMAMRQKDTRVLIFSLEMASDMILERMACIQLGVEYRMFTKQCLLPEQVAEVKEAAERWKRSENLLVLDDVYSIEGIAAEVAAIRPDLVIVDYIQKVTTTQKILTIRERIEYISGEFKRIAKYSGCCVLCLSQVARDGKDAPTMSSLKEAGGLEADGDYIIMLHRPYVQDKSNPDISPETAVLLIDKNKFGSTGAIDMRFDGAHQRFLEVEYSREDETI